MNDGESIFRYHVRADRLPFKRSGCRKCGTIDGHLARYIQIKGQVRCRWVCDSCGDYFTAGDLPFSWLRSIDVELESLPVCRDRSTEIAEYERCAVCDDRADDQHHWAPSALFPDWPFANVVPLCKEHHDEWHQIMRNHGLRWPHEIGPIETDAEKDELDRLWAESAA